MPANPLDFDAYTQTLQQTMGNAIAEAEILAAQAAADRQTTAELNLVRQAKLNGLESAGRSAANAYHAQHHRSMKEKMLADMWNLVNAGLSRLTH